MNADDRRLTPEEMAELARTPEGPLPPLESNDPDWRAERWRAWAAGERLNFGRHGPPIRTRVQATELRRWEADSAVVDLYCGPPNA